MNLNYNDALCMCKNTIGIFITGSTAHGTNLPTSDVDMKAISILPPEVMFRLGIIPETLSLHPEDFEQYPEFLQLLGIEIPTDVEIHTLGKFIELARKGNPTILEVLFGEKRFIVKRTPELDFLLTFREAFLSKMALHSFHGYSKQQLSRLKGDKVYKDAAHMLRVLTCGVELGKYGRLTVFRPDAEYFVSIRTGSLPLEDILHEAQLLFDEIKELFEVSPLPSRVNMELTSNIYTAIMMYHLGLNKELALP